MFIEATRLQVQGRVVLYKVEATRVIIKLILFLGCIRTRHNKPILFWKALFHRKFLSSFLLILTQI